MTQKLVFIVGLPKTGTKMIEHVLYRSPHIHYASCGETFFMGRFIKPGVRQQIKKMGDMHLDANVRRLVDMMYANAFRGGFWQRLSNGALGIDRDTLLHDLLASDRSTREIYRVILQCHTELRPDTVLGDKTPAHLYHVSSLLDWFPQAKVVHTFRDPRAILSSEWLKRSSRAPAGFYPVKPGQPGYALMVVLHVTVTWRAAVHLHRRYSRRYPDNYFLARFEQFVLQPEVALRDLCRFLEIDFHEQMLSPEQRGSSYERQGEVGFDRRAPTRWQQHLKPWMRSWLEFWARRPMRDFGYL